MDAATLIRFQCSCGQAMKAKIENVGRRVKCPKCAGVVAIPGQPNAVSPATKTMPQPVHNQASHPAPVPVSPQAALIQAPGAMAASVASDPLLAQTAAPAVAQDAFALPNDYQLQPLPGQAPGSAPYGQAPGYGQATMGQNAYRPYRPAQPVRKSNNAAAVGNVAKRIGFLIGGGLLCLGGLGLLAIFVVAILDPNVRRVNFRGLPVAFVMVSIGAGLIAKAFSDGK